MTQANVGHLDEETLSLFVLGALHGEARAEAEAHVDACPTCFQTLVELMAPTIPLSQIGSFQLLHVLGVGAGGIVYAAFDATLRRKVALKVLHVPEGVDRQRMQARLQREAQALAQVTHPNVVTVYQVGYVEGWLFIVMELVDGVPLSEWLALKRRSRREVADTFVAVAGGLAAVHRAGLLHRDIKPTNVLIGADGRPRLSDFGVAIDASEIAASQHLTGTPAYMSPEQRRREPLTAAADVYSLCLTFADVLRGERVILRGLSKTPDDRPRDGNALVQAWERSQTKRKYLPVATIALLATCATLLVMTSKQCPDAQKRFTSVWNEPRRQALRSVVTSQEHWEVVERAVERFAAQWRDTYENACAAENEQHVACANERLADLDGYLRLLADEPLLMRSASRLDEWLTACSDRTRPSRDPRVRDLRQRGLAISARVEQEPRQVALDLEMLLQHAASLGSPELETQLRMQLGLAFSRFDRQQAATEYQRASMAADAAQDDVMRARALLEAMTALLSLGARPEVDKLREQLRPVLVRLEDVPEIMWRVEEYNGFEQAEAHNEVQALAHYQRALSLFMTTKHHRLRDEAVLRGSICSIGAELDSMNGNTNSWQSCRDALDFIHAQPDLEAYAARVSRMFAYVLWAAGHHSEVLAMIETLVARIELRLGTSSDEYWQTLFARADFYRDSHRQIEALADYRQALAMSDARMGRATTNHFVLVARIAFVLLVTGQPAQALDILREGEQVRHELHTFVPDDLHSYAGVLTGAALVLSGRDLGGQRLVEASIAQLQSAPMLLDELQPVLAQLPRKR